MLALCAATAAAPPRIAVFGGSGFIGSRVCQTLTGAGCSVVSVSRTGAPPAWAAAQPWSRQVEWLALDALADGFAESDPVGRIDGAVSCVGNMRPAPEWQKGSFFGLHWDYATMLRENGEVNEAIAEVAQRAGARRLVLLSASSAMKWGFGGALEGYIDGKVRAEDGVRRVFGPGGTAVVGPSLVYGGGRFPRLGPILEANGRSAAARASVRFFKWLKRNAATGYGPQDASGEVASSPPVRVEVVAAAVAAALLQTIPPTLQAAHLAEQLQENKVRGSPLLCGLDDARLEPPFVFVDGPFQIRAVAEQAGEPQLLAAAAAAALTTGGALSTTGATEPPAGGGTAAAVPLPAVAQPASREAEWRVPPPEEAARAAASQSPTAHGAPNEGALFGFKPYLYPVTPTILLFGSFAGAIYAGSHPA